MIGLMEDHIALAAEYAPRIARCLRARAGRDHDGFDRWSSRDVSRLGNGPPPGWVP